MQSIKKLQVAKSKSLLKEYYRNKERVVYLNNGDEFQLQLFNPQTFTVGAKIYVNNELLSNSLIVLRPGERIWLERHIDNSRRLKFETYDVPGDKSLKEAMQNAIQYNGVVKVEFYRERKKRENPIFISTPLYYHSTDVYTRPITTDVVLGTNSCVSTSKCIDDSLVSSCTHATMDSAVDCAATCASAVDSVITSFSTASSATTLGTGDSGNKKKGIVTGRIEEGSYSSQALQNVYDKDFEYSAYDVETVHILPSSQKPVTHNDLKKIYCHQCGRKLKSEYKFCPHCGARL